MQSNNMDMNVYNMGGFFASYVNGVGWVMEVVPLVKIHAKQQNGHECL